MATQYEAVAASYNQMRQHPASRLIDYNVKIAVGPSIKGTKVLDLACGTGIYTKALSAWGASQVLGVDISEGMIDVAQSGSVPDNVQFQVGDCSKPTIFGSGEYDLVVGAWLLNYASTREELTNMYRTIAMNLKEGGRFIGITPHPTDDPEAFAAQSAEVRPVKVGEVGDLIWKAIEFPGDDVEDPALQQNADYWHSYKTVPHFGTLVIPQPKGTKLDGS